MNTRILVLGTALAVLTWTGVGAAQLPIARHISAGGTHTCAVRDDNTVWCWGDNFYGQLGDPLPPQTDVPQQVSDSTGPIADATSIAAGLMHVCSLSDTGH